MKELNWATHVAASVDAVGAYHALPNTIRRLTPPVIPMSIHRMDSLAEGSISDFTLWFGPLPVRWRALHIDVDPKSGFTDVQTSGPFKYWNHQHRYDPDPQGGSMIVEHIDYQHAGGLRGLITRVLFSRPMLYLLFTYRSFIFRRALNSEPTSASTLPGGTGAGLRPHGSGRDARVER